MRKACLFSLLIFLVVTAGQAQSSVTVKPEEWRADLRYFASELPRRHLNFYHDLTPEEFSRAVNELDAAIPTKSDAEIQIGFFRLAAMVKEAHTFVNWAVNGTIPYFRRLPLSVAWFQDGLYATGITEQAQATGRGGRINYRRLLGARLVKIGETDIAEVVRRLSALISHENDYGLRAQIPTYLITPEVLKETGIIENIERVVLTFEMEDGQRVPLSLAPVLWTQSLTGIASTVRKDLPLYRQNTNVNYWYRWLEDSRTIWLQYNRCTDLANNPMTNFAAEMFRVADENGATRFVIDLRNNPGGSSEVIRPVIAALRNRPWLNQRGRLYVVTGNATASSAMMCAIDFRNQTNAILLGEPTGGKPNHYGNVATLMLPNSGLVCGYSIKYFNLAQTDSAAVFPDVMIPLKAAEFISREDPVLSYILAN